MTVTAKESGGKIVFAGEKMTAASLCGRTAPHLLAVKEKDKCGKADFILFWTVLSVQDFTSFHEPIP